MTYDIYYNVTYDFNHDKYILQLQETVTFGYRNTIQTWYDNSKWVPTINNIEKHFSNSVVE